MGFLPSHSNMLDATAKDCKPHKRKNDLGLGLPIVQEEQCARWNDC